LSELGSLDVNSRLAAAPRVSRTKKLAYSRATILVSISIHDSSLGPHSVDSLWVHSLDLRVLDVCSSLRVYSIMLKKDNSYGEIATGEHYSVLRHSRPFVLYRSTKTSVPISIFGNKPLPKKRRVFLQKRGFRTGLLCVIARLESSVIDHLAVAGR
jgi:hypothetical protein